MDVIELEREPITTSVGDGEEAPSFSNSDGDKPSSKPSLTPGPDRDTLIADTNLEDDGDSDKDDALAESDDIQAYLYQSCRFGNSYATSLLLKHGVKAKPDALRIALLHGYESIVKQLIQTPQWPLLMRQTFNTSTTPFREMIRKMPGLAEEILNKCTLEHPDTRNPDNRFYSVIFNYEFVEDTRDDEKGNNESDPSKIESHSQEVEERSMYGCDYRTLRACEKRNYTTSWGPVGFKKENHPLAIMVEYKRLNLLTHPLVGSLLHHKWKAFGQYGYFFNLLTYCVFLIFLTTFALIIENPRSQSCLALPVNVSGMGINGSEELSNGDTCIGITCQSFIYISAVIVIILSLCRLVLEGVQFITQFPRYVLDWVNWMEVALYLLAIIFVWVFHVDGLCSLTWQWQIGVVAVFLGWVDLIVFISKFPLTGIYVLMFVKMLYTFLKMLVLSVLLVVAFGLTFYLAFTQPEILRSPFSNPGRSLLKTMTMTAGDFDFDSIFRLDPAGGSDDAEEIPFPPVSYMLWIIFVIIMPILLTNMLVGLAVGDIQAVQEEAKLQKLALQVEQVLNVEELLPRKLRRRFTHGSKEVYPNCSVSWRKKFLFHAWGGERYDTRASIEKVLRPQQDSVEYKLLHEIEDLKASVNGEVDGLKVSVNDQVEGLKASVNDEVEGLKTSVDDMKQLLKQIIVKLDALENTDSEATF